MKRSRSDAPLSGPMAVLTIGFESVLLPQAAAIKAMQALAGAIEVKRDFRSHREVWQVQEPIDISIALLKSADQVIVRPQLPEPLAITDERKLR